MDSITQAALGAAIGEKVLGEKAGYRAPLYGAVAAIIPDLDIVFMPFMDELQKMTFHRGISHSFVFLLVLTPFLGVLFHKMYPGSNTSRNDWIKLCFWALLTHPVLDTFTQYGTQLFLPFSDYRAGFNSIFIIDPLYTAPLALGVIAALFFVKSSRKRRIINNLGLGISTLYLSLTLVNKMYVDSVFRESLQERNIAYSRFMTNPAPLSNILWMSVVDGTDDYWIGYYSLLDNSNHVSFSPVPKNHHLIESIKENPAIQRIIHVSNGYYAVREVEGNLVIHDVKFGQMGGWIRGNGSFVFSYKILRPDSQTVTIERYRTSFSNAGDAFDQLVQRIKGT